LTEEKTLFLRRASGLARAWNIFDGFIYCIYGASIFGAASLAYALSFPWPDGNIPLAIVLTCLGVYPCAIVYAMNSSTMPRVGGDYIWQSRVFGGFWGYTLCLVGIGFWTWFFVASNVLPGTVGSVSPTFFALGIMSGNQGMIDFASWLTTTDGLWWAYVAFCVWAFLIMVAGMKWYGRVQRWLFYIGCLVVVIWVAMLAITTHQDYVNNFNWFMSTYFNWGGANPYQYVIDQAVSAGYSPVPFDQTKFMPSWQLIPVMSYVFPWIMWAGPMAGEISGITDLKKSLWMYVGSNTFGMIVCAGTMYATIMIVGNEFLFSASYMWFAMGGASAIPMSPFLGFLYLTMTRNPFFWIMTVIGMNAWYWIWPTNGWVNTVRMYFAMSFDRALPGWFGAVDKRLRSPLNAIIFSTIGTVVMGWVYIYTPFWKFTLDALVGAGAVLAASTLAGTVMPYRKRTKALWEASPASKYKVGNVPVITIAGILGTVFYWIPTFFMWITDSRYGVNDPLSAVVVISSFVVGGILYYAMKLYRKSRGIDLNLLFREIPYE